MTTTTDRPAVDYFGGRTTHPAVEAGTSIYETALQLRREAPDFKMDQGRPFVLVMQEAAWRVEDVHGPWAAQTFMNVCQALVDHEAGGRGVTKGTWERYIRMIYAGDWMTVSDRLHNHAHWCHAVTS